MWNLKSEKVELIWDVVRVKGEDVVVLDFKCEMILKYY